MRRLREFWPKPELAHGNHSRTLRSDLHLGPDPAIRRGREVADENVEHSEVDHPHTACLTLSPRNTGCFRALVALIQIC